LGNPLDFIAEDHLRERQICALIDGVANAAHADLADVQNILSFLGEELTMHLEDEEAGLFPMMSDKCHAEDDIDSVIERLRSDHAKMGGAVPQVRQSLERLLSGAPPLAEDQRAMLTEFASETRRHLIVENAIILPIARARLDTDDLDALRLGMLRRRGLDRLMEELDAE
jgi:iron-sulfur cluster repair protein YtfE (RIC family)